MVRTMRDTAPTTSLWRRWQLHALGYLSNPRVIQREKNQPPRSKLVSLSENGRKPCFLFTYFYSPLLGSPPPSSSALLLPSFLSTDLARHRRVFSRARGVCPCGRLSLSLSFCLLFVGKDLCCFGFVFQSTFQCREPHQVSTERGSHPTGCTDKQTIDDLIAPRCFPFSLRRSASSDLNARCCCCSHGMKTDHHPLRPLLTDVL